MEYIKLSNGVEMPLEGYGVFQIAPQDTVRCVSDAISVGYRMIDTAQAYNNEREVGLAVANSGLDRNELFIVSKIWPTNYGNYKAKASIDESLRKLGTEYIDLMLLHQQQSDYAGAYRALEEAYKEGKVRAIGVSNFFPEYFADLAGNAEIPPMINQVMTNVFHQQIEMQEIMNSYDAHLMAWSPLAEGMNNFFSNPLLASIGAKYGKSIAQVALRWMTQRGIIVIPKSTRIERMKQNLNIFDFTLSDDDMKAIATLDGVPQFNLGYLP